MLDFNHSATINRTDIPTAEDFDAAAAAIQTKQTKRDYLGGSRLGETCLRKLQYEYQGAKPDRTHKASTRAIFAFGHAGEDAVAELLRAIGFDLRTAKPSGQQFGFSTAGGRIRGHIDGVLCGGPDRFGPYPRLWECKWVGDKYWQKIVKRGVVSERPIYAAQVAIYQAYMDLAANPALFTTGNRDTGEIFCEWLPFDAKVAQQASDRGVAVIQASEAGETLPRGHTDQDSFGCRFCDYRETCWRGA